MNMPATSSTPPASARRQEASLDLPVDPPRDGESKQAWVYRQIRERVLGRAAVRRALPSTRSLAQRWRIARSTVEAAYDQLRGEGYTAGTVGSGTYVAAVIPDNFFRKGLPERAGRPGARMQGTRRARPRSPRPSRGRAAGARCRMSSRRRPRNRRRPTNRRSLRAAPTPRCFP